MSLRPRLVLALFATAAASLAVAALAQLPPLQARLRADAERTLVLHAEAVKDDFEREHARTHELLRDLARATGAEVVLVGRHGVLDDTDPEAPGNLNDAHRVLVTRRSEHAVAGDVASAAVAVRVDGRADVLALRRRLGDVERTAAVVKTAFLVAAGAGLLLALAGGLLLSG